MDHFTITPDKINGKFAIHFRIRSFSGLDENDIAGLRKIGVTQRNKEFWLTENVSRRPNEIDVQTRTVLGMLNYFAKGVDVPEV
ncbi:MAG: hypothetical protein O2966_08155, partial [Proteobacteria bacterium]|nr:hypothetical protein [Pseudomonadota bacterium]